MAHAAHEALSTDEAVPLYAGGPKLKVLVVTFNLGNAPPSEAELKDWLPVHEGYDIIAFGLQESTYNMRKRGRAAAAAVSPAGSGANSPANRVAAAPVAAAAAAAAAAVEFTAEDSDDEAEMLACAAARSSSGTAAAAADTIATATELLNRDESFTPERATSADSEAAALSDGSPPTVSTTATTTAAATAAVAAEAAATGVAAATSDADTEDVTATSNDDSAGRTRGSRPSSGTTQAFKRLVDAGAVHLRGLIRGEHVFYYDILKYVLLLLQLYHYCCEYSMRSSQAVLADCRKQAKQLLAD
jgi:hypothetical protein